MVKRGDTVEFGCGASNNGLEVYEMAEILTDKGLRLWLVMHTVTQAQHAISPTGIENNLPMDAVTEGNRGKRSPIIVVYPREIVEVVQPVYQSKKSK